MSSTMKHENGYIARIEFDSEVEIFFGTVINTPNAITFYGKSVRALRTEFNRSVREYLAVCRENGLEPNKPYSGRLNLRLPPELHGSAAAAATMAGVSLNAFIANAVRERTAATLWVNDADDAKQAL